MFPMTFNQRLKGQNVSFIFKLFFLQCLSFLVIKINRRQFFSTLRRVIDASDIILEVLDARDPEGTRCVSLERSASAQAKNVVIVLNKIGFT